jgi:hypothetical protein
VTDGRADASGPVGWTSWLPSRAAAVPGTNPSQGRVQSWTVTPSNTRPTPEGQEGREVLTVGSGPGGDAVERGAPGVGDHTEPKPSPRESTSIESWSGIRLTTLPVAASTANSSSGAAPRAGPCRRETARRRRRRSRWCARSWSRPGTAASSRSTPTARGGRRADLAGPVALAEAAAQAQHEAQRRHSGDHGHDRRAAHQAVAAWSTHTPGGGRCSSSRTSSVSTERRRSSSARTSFGVCGLPTAASTRVSNTCSHAYGGPDGQARAAWLQRQQGAR